jgi:hypothetical protein
LGRLALTFAAACRQQHQSTYEGSDRKYAHISRPVLLEIHTRIGQWEYRLGKADVKP